MAVLRSGRDLWATTLEVNRRAWKEHRHLGALFDALRICTDSTHHEGRPVPPWLKESLAEAIATGHDRPLLLQRIWRRHRRDLVHAARSERLQDYREHGFSWAEARASAAANLRGSPAAGSEGAIMQSYKLVKRAEKHGSLRYYIPFETRLYLDRHFAPQRPFDEKTAQLALRMQARRFLAEWLEDGPRTGADIRQAAAKCSLPWPAVEWARRRLKIKVIGAFRPEKQLWRLAPPS